MVQIPVHQIRDHILPKSGLLLQTILRKSDIENFCVIILLVYYNYKQYSIKRVIILSLKVGINSNG